jgi:hypothetical protein
MTKSLLELKDNIFWDDRPVPDGSRAAHIDSITNKPKPMMGIMGSLSNMPSIEELREWKEMAGMDDKHSGSGEEENDMYFGGYDAEGEEGGYDEV